MNLRSREEVLNVTLARLLRDRGIVSAAERILTVPAIGRRAMPEYNKNVFIMKTRIATTYEIWC